jgi:hypothetical protein
MMVCGHESDDIFITILENQIKEKNSQKLTKAYLSWDREYHL